MKEIIEELTVSSQSDDIEILRKALLLAITHLKYLQDENASVWSLIEEQKASEIEAHSVALKAELNKKITETLGLVRSKVISA